MSKLPLVAFVLLAACGAGRALTCDELKAQIAHKIDSAGVARYSLAVTEAGREAPGRQVGICENGTRKIMYTQLPSGSVPARDVQPARAVEPAGRPVAPGRSKDVVLTECKEGFAGPNCAPVNPAAKGAAR